MSTQTPVKKKTSIPCLVSREKLSQPSSVPSAVRPQRTLNIRMNMEDDVAQMLVSLSKPDSPSANNGVDPAPPRTTKTVTFTMACRPQVVVPPSPPLPPIGMPLMTSVSNAPVGVTSTGMRQVHVAGAAYAPNRQVGVGPTPKRSPPRPRDDDKQAEERPSKRARYEEEKKKGFSIVIDNSSGFLHAMLATHGLDHLEANLKALGVINVRLLSFFVMSDYVERFGPLPPLQERMLSHIVGQVRKQCVSDWTGYANMMRQHLVLRQPMVSPVGGGDAGVSSAADASNVAKV